MKETEKQIEAINTATLFLESTKTNPGQGVNWHWQTFKQSSNPNFGSFGHHQTGFNALIEELKKIPSEKYTSIFRKADAEIKNINSSIDNKKEELNKLEVQYTNLTTLIGSYKDKDGKEISIATELIKSLQDSVNDLRSKRDDLISEISIEKENLNKLFVDYEVKNNELSNKFAADKNYYEEKIKTKEEQANTKIEEIEKRTNQRVKIIEQFGDFLEETNRNMRLYACSIFGLIFVFACVGWFASSFLIQTLGEFSTYFSANNPEKVTQIIAYSFSLLIIKLPWALFFIAVIAGIYKLLRSIIVIYEKINQDKRNMSAIYAISLSVANNLNEKGLALISDDGKMPSKEEIEAVRESTRWKQIADYFTRMNNNVSLFENDKNQISKKP